MAAVTPAAWLAAASIGSAAAVSLLTRAPDRAAIVLGMAAPLVATTSSWLVIAHAYRLSPARVMPVMLRAWAAKAAFFVAYVVLALKGLEVAATPFVASFTAYFIALYAAQALLLQRLFSRAWRGAR